MLPTLGDQKFIFPLVVSWSTCCRGQPRPLDTIGNSCLFVFVANFVLLFFFFLYRSVHFSQFHILLDGAKFGLHQDGMILSVFSQH